MCACEKRDIISDFIDWCEKTERTEWMGYYTAKNKVLDEYFKEYKNNVVIHM